ncbi:hypothetical protein E4K72_05895 [Oxalobacteraceae bacterium OM1]|nr:hypothetical protein E4K72_05895 [Oxalobacteraceae bacterium OM1]
MLDWHFEAKEPSPLAVKCGRFVFCFAGLALLGIPLVFAYFNPEREILLVAACMGTGLVLIWLRPALPCKTAAHFGFWLPWFLPDE